MAISQTQIVDYLNKKVGYGVAKTDTSTAKGPSNESNASPLLSPGTTIWQQDYLIPAVSVLPSANNSVVTVYRDSLSTTVQSINLAESTTNQTWATGLTNWIPTQYGSGYQLQIYAAPSGTANPQTAGVSLPQAGSGNNDSWFFDYQAGILNFADTNVPTAVTWNGSTGNVVYVVGARYTGATGIITWAAPLTFNNTTTFNGNITSNLVTANIITSNNQTINSNLTVANVNASANIAATYYFGNGSQLTGMYGNTQVAAYLPIFTGNINANNITAANQIIGYYNGVIGANNANSATFTTANVNTNLYASNIFANNIGNSGSTFTAANATISSNLSVGNVNTSANVTASYFYGSGQFLTGVTSYSNANVAGYLPVYGANISGDWINANYHYGNLISSNLTASNANANITITPGLNGYVSVNTSTALQVPVGSSSQYPSTYQVGMIRWNTTNSYLEVYSGIKWEAVGTEGSTSLITTDQFLGDGTTTVFTLSQNNTTAGTLVSINGVIQIPTTSYNVSGNVLTLSEAPLSTDIVEARSIVSLKQNNVAASGTNTQIQYNDNNNFNGATNLLYYKNTGNLVINGNVTLTSVNYNTANTNINSNTNIIDSWNISTYRTASYTISGSSGTNFQSCQAIVVQNGSTANISVYGNTWVGTPFFNLSANIYTGKATLWATTNANGYFRVANTYIPL